MEGDRWQRLLGLFEEARKLPVEQQNAFLVSACHGDDAFRAEVESLLAHGKEAGSEFLAGPQLGSPNQGNQPTPAEPTEAANVAGRSRNLPADSIQGYQITRELHRGGQGIVYQAIQKSTKRKVALKVMLEGPFASEKTRRRFEREIELVASLHHPNIVAIFDSGIAHDKHWFAMDYIRGRPLDQFAAAKDLSIENALRLFAKICEAVNYAHQRGVIHRDLKPGNILVDEQGEPHVLDFGLAKVAGAEAFGDSRPMLVSVTGQVIGTLPYMSPEQTKGDPSQIDIRTDVYSLGVILYELLTGKYPYEVVGQMSDVLRNIQETEPRRPSTIRRQINNELETVLFKSLAKDRERRYQSAAELGRDLEHYLSGEPIEAKRDSGFYLLKKSLLRHRAQIATGAAFLLITLAVSAVFLWRTAKSNQQKEDSESHRLVGYAWSLARERGDLRGALAKLEEIVSTRAKSVDFFLVKGAVTTSRALEARIDEKPELTRQAIAEFQNAHIAAGGQRFWDGSSVLDSFSESQSAGSASALRAAAGLVMLNDWEPDTTDARLAADTCRLYSAAEHIENRMGKSAGPPWDPMPPAYDYARDPLAQKKLHEENPAEARQRADENAEIVRLIANPVKSFIREPDQLLESRFVTELLFDDLMVLNQELHWVPNENLVSTMLQDADNRRGWTIDLNANARWHDGFPLTADDVEFSWRVFPHGDEERLESVEADGVHRVRITHKRVRNTALQDMRIPVYPKHIWAHLATPDKKKAIQRLKESFGSKPIGNGPYQLEPSEGSRIVLTRWEKYYGQHPMIRRITFEVDPSRSSRARKLADGHADTSEMKAEDFYWHVNGASFADRVTKVRHDKYEYNFIMWNLREQSLLANKELRMAIAHAIDLAALRRFLYGGVYDQCLGIFQGQVGGGAHSGGDLGYDPRRAQELLSASLANENESDGAASRSTGEKQLTINLLVPTDFLSPRLAARVLREQVKAVGIDLKLHERPFTRCKEIFKNENGVELANGSRTVFHGFYSGVQRDGDLASDAVRFRSDSTRNWGQYRNKEVDDLLGRAAEATEPDKEGEYYSRVQRIIFEDQPYLILWQKPSLWAFNDRLRGIKFSKMGPALFYPGPRAWWVPATSRQP